MKTCKILRRTIAALLLVVTCLVLCPSAFAFDLDQYYVADYSLTQVYTVQIAASKSLSSSESVRDKMLRAGFDCFVYQYEGKYRIMCGKFRDYSDAEDYLRQILKSTDYSSAYINNAWLPEWAITSFENDYWGYWPSDWTWDSWYWFEADQYYEADYSQTKVYTVQVAATKYLSGAQTIRDEMLGYGFDCFVYKYDGKYRVMCGKFYDYSDAEAYQKGILNTTSYSHAYINNAWLPLYAVDYFQNVYYYGYGQAG